MVVLTIVGDSGMMEVVIFSFFFCSENVACCSCFVLFFPSL